MASDAESDEEVEVGGSAEGPEDRVVDLQMGVVAAGCGADTVLAGDHSTALQQVGLVLGGAGVEDLRLPVTPPSFMRKAVKSDTHRKYVSRFGPIAPWPASLAGSVGAWGRGS